MARLIRFFVIFLLGAGMAGCAVPPLPVAFNIATIVADSYSVVQDGRTTTDRVVDYLNQDGNSTKGDLIRQVAQLPGASSGTSARFKAVAAKRVQDCDDSTAKGKRECAIMDTIRGAGAGHITPFMAGDHKPAQVVIGRRGFSIPIMNLKARRWQAVVRQQHDISCGAAVVATLLSHHYAIETSEKTVFEAMFEKGDQKKIKKFGFSLLDMKLFLQSRGLRAEGFRSSIDKLASVGVPAVVLLNLKGYRHFVLVKGIKDGKVLVGDPAFGLKVFDRKEFQKLLVNDIVFVLLDHGGRGKASFNRQIEWAHLGKAPIEMARNMATLQSIFRMSLPSINEF